LVFEVFQGGTKQIKEKKMRTLNDYFITSTIADISTASSTFVPVPDGGRVIKIITALQGAIGTANGGITFEIGGTAITGGGITVAYSGSAAGDVDTAEPTAANEVSEDGTIEMITDGASSNTIKLVVTFVIRR
jgi:hypothetical protein